MHWLTHRDGPARALSVLASEIDWFEVSGDGSRLVVRADGDLSVISAEHKPDADSPADRVRVDLSRARYMADPAALWRAAYEEAGRIIQHDFWVPGMAGVELTVAPAGHGRPRRVVVSTLENDRRLRYRDWVAGRRRRVRELSDGKIGYLHVPDMMSEGWPTSTATCAASWSATR